MILQLEEDEQLIGRSHLILKKGNYIKKYYPNFFVLAAKGDVNRYNFYINHIKKSTYFMKIVHPDLYVSDETDNNFYCVISRLQHKTSLGKGNFICPIKRCSRIN